MFNAWRKAWIKDQEGSIGDGSSSRRSATPKEEQTSVDDPETTGDGAQSRTVSDALAHVSDVDSPEIKLPTASSASTAVHIHPSEVPINKTSPSLQASTSIPAEVSEDMIDPHPAKRRKIAPSSTPVAPDQDEALQRFEAAVNANSAQAYSSRFELDFLIFLFSPCLVPHQVPYVQMLHLLSITSHDEAYLQWNISLLSFSSLGHAVMSPISLKMTRIGN